MNNDDYMTNLSPEIISEFKFRIVFDSTGKGFSACYKAEKWLKERGFGFGSMQAPEPRAIQHGLDYLPKWRYFDLDMIRNLDGVMISSDWRNGSVEVFLKKPA